MNNPVGYDDRKSFSQEATELMHDEMRGIQSEEWERENERFQDEYESATEELKEPYCDFCGHEGTYTTIMFNHLPHDICVNCYLSWR